MSGRERVWVKDHHRVRQFRKWKNILHTANKIKYLFSKNWEGGECCWTWKWLRIATLESLKCVNVRLFCWLHSSELRWYPGRLVRAFMCYFYSLDDGRLRQTATAISTAIRKSSFFSIFCSIHAMKIIWLDNIHKWAKRNDFYCIVLRGLWDIMKYNGF